MAERFRALRLLLGLLILVVVLAGTYVVHLQHSGRPLRTGDLPLAGLDAAVEVRFDARGVPHVRAETDDDLARALGWLHANDRLTQMELGRRAAAGRLSELLGEATLDTDIYFRTLRFPETAEMLWQSASAPSRRWLEAYAEGVNGRIQAPDQRLPTGLRILGAELEPWQPTDSLAFVLLMARDLSFWNERPEEERFLWLRAFGVEGVRDLLGNEALHVPDALVEMALELGPLPEQRSSVGGSSAPDAGAKGGSEGGVDPEFSSSEPPAPGSNNWALGGSRTESGQPLLANDPHLGLYLPSIWYQAQLRGPGYAAAGMTIPGAPGVIIGRGEKVAWAFTNVMLDDHDLFFERLDESGERVLRRAAGVGASQDAASQDAAERDVDARDVDGREGGAEWVDIVRERQVIRLRGGDTHEIELARTDLGPLLAADDERGLPPRSLAWTAHFPADPVAALRGLAMAETAEEALAAIDAYVCPAQNLVAAFADGNLLWTPIGRIPARGTDPRSDRLERDPGPAYGRMASPGWDPTYAWNGLRASASNPRLLRPENDLIVTANHDVRPDDYPLPLVADFFAPFRADRIRERLLERQRWSREPFADVQMDAVSPFALRLVAAIGPGAGPPGSGPPGAGQPGSGVPDAVFEGDARRALDTLRAWDGTMDVRGPSALFALFHRQLLRRVFDDESRAAGLPRTVAHRDRLDRLVHGEMAEHWFDDVETEAKETRGQVFAAALAAAWQETVARWGEDPDQWNYGELHALRLDHRLDAVPLFGDWARRGPYAVPGSSTTVLAFGAAWRGEIQRITYGPSMRFVVDWSEPDRAWAILPGGQSGHPGDPHYDDQVDDYLAGELHEAPWSEEAIEAATVDRLRLLP